MKMLRVVNLAKYQHYKERRPPWVKLHRTVLSDYRFSRLQDASKAHLMLLWLLASEHDNALPYDAEWLMRKVDASAPVNIEELVSAGFLEAYEDDSIALAPRVQDASKKGSTENREQRTETDPPRKAAVVRTIRPTPNGTAFSLAPYLDAHAARFPGGQPSAGQLGKVLKPLEAAHGPAETLARWKVFLAAKGTLGVHKFAETWSEWGTAPTNGARPSRVLAATEQLLEFP